MFVLLASALLYCTFADDDSGWFMPAANTSCNSHDPLQESDVSHPGPSGHVLSTSAVLPRQTKSRLISRQLKRLGLQRHRRTCRLCVTGAGVHITAAVGDSAPT